MNATPRAARSIKNPHIKMDLPGPKSRAMIERDSKVASPSYPRDYPFVISHGKGTEAWDVDGNRFLDFAAGIAVCATGHAHPRVVKAVQGAAEKFLHISSDYWHEEMTSLAERLSAIVPLGEPGMCFFCQSGTESVEGALKLARYVTKRQRIIAFLGSFHGRTMGSLSLTSSKYTQQAGFFPSMPGVTHVPYPNTYRPLFAGNDQGKAVLDYIRMLFERNVPPSEVAAIVIEPLQGEGGYLVPPEGFLEGLRKLCDEHGILLVFDEVQSGIGRTGRLFASQHTGVTPDIMTLAKGLGSGMPIGAVVAKASLMKQWKKGAHGNTFGGNPVCCAAANATIDLVREQYVQNAAKVGAHFMKRLEELRPDYPCIGDIRGRGLMIGVEMIEKDGSPARALVDRILHRAYHNGLLLLSCGVSTLRFMPPLCVTEAEVDEAMGYLRQPRRGARGRARESRPRAPPCAPAALARRRRRARASRCSTRSSSHSNYYWRELYIPQLTTGPSSAAFMPSGDDLVYSMEGSLRRQKTGTDDADRDHAREGAYDHQPDVAPDGGSVVFTRYDGRASSCGATTSRAAASRRLTANGGVNLEPRISPDGRKIVFVSTAEHRTFNLKIVDLGALGARQ